MFLWVLGPSGTPHKNFLPPLFYNSYDIYLWHQDNRIIFIHTSLIFLKIHFHCRMFHNFSICKLFAFFFSDFAICCRMFHNSVENSTVESYTVEISTVESSTVENSTVESSGPRLSQVRQLQSLNLLSDFEARVSQHLNLNSRVIRFYSARLIL